MIPRTSFAAVALCLTASLVACSPDDGAMKDAGGPRPNGVGNIKPARAVAAARQAMNELHDAVYASTVTVELEGRTKRVRLVETFTANGCIRETSHPEFGRSWVRVIGRTMWLKTNDKAAESLGRTPAQIELFRGRWLKLRAPDLLRGCDLEYLLPTRRDAELVRAAGRAEVEGTLGRRFHVSGGGLSISFVIATQGLPLMISSRTTGDPAGLTELPTGMSFDGTTVLTDIDTGAEVVPPPDRLVIDPEDFQVAPA